MSKHFSLIYSLTLSLFFFVSVCKNQKQLQSSKSQDTKLNGTWILYYISGPKIAFEALYPNKKPQIKIDINSTDAGGNSSCNSFGAPVKIEGNIITFGEPIATMMACDGDGESTFFNTLKKINSYSINNNDTLNLNSDNVAMMRLVRVKK